MHNGLDEYNGIAAQPLKVIMPVKNVGAYVKTSRKVRALYFDRRLEAVKAQFTTSDSRTLPENEAPRDPTYSSHTESGQPVKQKHANKIPRVQQNTNDKDMVVSIRAVRGRAPS